MEQLLLGVLALQVMIIIHGVVLRFSPAHLVGISILSLAVFPPDQAPLAYTTISAFLGAGAAVAALSQSLLTRENHSRSRGGPFGWALAFVLMYFLVTAITGSASVFRVLLVYAPALSLGYVVSYFSAYDRRVLMGWLCGIGLFQLGIGVLEALGVMEPLWGVRNVERFNNLVELALPRAQGSLGHPIVYSFFMLVILVVAMRTRAHTPRGMRSVMVVTALAGIFLSGTRAAVVALAVILILQLLAQRRVYGVLAGLAVLTGVAVFAIRNLDRIRGVVVEALESGSFQHRTGVIADSVNLLHQPLPDLIFGNGFRSIQELFRTGVLATPDGLLVIDNNFVYIVATGGLLGLFLWVGLMCSLLFFGRADVRLVAMLILVFSFSFDLVGWPIIMTLFLVICLQARSFDDQAETTEEADGELTEADRAKPTVVRQRSMSVV